VSCFPPICGDGYINAAVGEQCERDFDCLGLGTPCTFCQCL
jgi:hypothetical protein